jgi:hypothetical protein
MAVGGLAAATATRAPEGDHHESCCPMQAARLSSDRTVMTRTARPGADGIVFESSWMRCVD